MRKIIIFSLLLFLLFGIKEQVLAAFNPDCNNPAFLTSPVGGATVGPGAVSFSWSDGCGGSRSYTISIWGPGLRVEECKDGWVGGYSLPAGTLFSGDPPCKYYWKIRAWKDPNCQGEYSKKWSVTENFKTPVYAGEKCPSVSGVPGVVKPIECCKLNYNFEDVDENCERDSVVADPDNRTCQWTVDATTTRWSVCCFLNSLYKISDWLTWLVAPFAILVSLVGAWTLTTSGGDPQRVNKGRDLIVWAVLGAVVCFLIKAILAIIKMVV